MPLAFETVFEKGQGADFWLIKYNAPQELTYAELQTEYEPYRHFDAFKNRNIFVCNTGKTPYYEEMPMHPDRVLGDLIEIFHPGTIPGQDAAVSISVRYIVAAACCVAVLFAASLFLGSVPIPLRAVLGILTGGEAGQASWSFIVLESRLPQAVTALLAGAALATSGLMLQTVFNNPLAGPSILGIDTGASLGVALVMLMLGGTVGGTGGFMLSGYMAVVSGAFVGATAVLCIIIFFSTLVRSNVMLLIIGIMVGYLASSMISLLNFFATSDGVYSYMLWGMGDFSGVSLRQMPLFALLIGTGLFVALLLMKPLNALLLGERYAENLGVRVQRVRILLLISTGVLTAVSTAFCGPIAFIGLSVPHLARLMTGSADHRLLLPAVMLTGSCVALLCNLISLLPGASGVIPLNAITPLVGAPVVIYVIVNQKRIQYFN